MSSSQSFEAQRLLTNVMWSQLRTESLHLQWLNIIRLNRGFVLSGWKHGGRVASFDETGRLGVGACASKILGTGQSSNVNAITGIHYFHQSNFYFRQHHFSYREKIYLIRIFCIDPASISIKKELFSSQQHTLRNNSLHPIQSSFHFS